MPRSKAGNKAKGKRGEREVAALWRAYGWERACPTPGSGAMRPWGAGDIPAWPADIAFIAPWICECKFDERMRAASRGWTGEAFVRRTLREHDKLLARLSATVGGKAPLGCMVGRGSFEAFRWFVPEWLFLTYTTPELSRSGAVGWVELDTEHFFDLALTLSPPG